MQELETFLRPTPIINFQHPEIRQLVDVLAGKHSSESAYIQASFEWVRDSIQHTSDFNRVEVTCVASDVLRSRTGFCYAKSHLLAALLRARRIPAGFCYQRLSINGTGAPYCLHGLNAVYLQSFGWYRLDPRGNTSTLQATFAPPTENLPFQPTGHLECNFPEVWDSPLEVVTCSLQSAESATELSARLPDATETDMQSWREAAPPVLLSRRD